MAFHENKVQRNGVPMSVQYIRILQNGQHIHPKWHYHEYSELLFGISGTATVCMGDRRFELPAGSMAIIDNDIPHDVISPGSKCCYHVVKFLPKILLTMEQSYPEYNYVTMLMESLPDKQFFFSADEPFMPEVARLFGRIREEWTDQRFGYELSLRADVTHIYLHILRHWREKNLSLIEDILRSGQQELMQRVLTYVQEHYSDLTEESAAHACGVSPSYLSRCFKKHMRTSFSAYLTSIRLREAERLLLSTSQSVTEIAQNVGFSTSAYFIALFREARQISPGRYRKLCRQSEADGGSPS